MPVISAHSEGHALTGGTRLQVFASDYDDTVARDGSLDPSVLDGFATAQRAGVKIVLVSGREIPSLVSVFPALSSIDFVVGENGGCLYVPSTELGWRIAPNVDPALVEQLEQHGVDNLLIGETIISAHVQHREVIDKAIAASGANYDVILNRISAMLLPHGIDKGSGLNEALKHLEVPASATLAIGDAENDVAFLRAAGFGVAVGDAVHELMTEADYVVPAPGPQGVASVLSQLDSCDWDLARFAESVSG